MDNNSLISQDIILPAAAAVRRLTNPIAGMDLDIIQRPILSLGIRNQFPWARLVRGSHLPLDPRRRTISISRDSALVDRNRPDILEPEVVAHRDPNGRSERNNLNLGLAAKGGLIFALSKTHSGRTQEENDDFPPNNAFISDTSVNPSFLSALFS